MGHLDDRLKGMTPLQRAVFALKQAQGRLDALEHQRNEPVAIIGMACRFPGGANDPESYWRMLREGTDAIREIPPDRWDVDALYDPDPAVPGKMCTRWGGFLEGIDEFDNHFFGISDHEAARIDPQHRMLMELCWEALEDAGLPPGRLSGGKVGVFVGISISDYAMLLMGDLSRADAHVATGTSLCLAANRLSFAFGWQGPSIALDTACSSSLVAAHLACQHLRQGECEMAIVGGSSMLLSPMGNVNQTKAGLCSRDGRVRAFDAEATGYVRSEGAGLLVLKPLSSSLRDRDPIYAVIRGSAVNQNGTSNGLSAPSRPGQEQVLREAHARAGVSPGQIRYVETQGTGTLLGDAIEAHALGSILGEGRPPGSRCAIGSVKTNIGHMEAAAGVAGLIKVALALRHGELPPSLHFRKPNPDIPFDRLALRVQDRLGPWPDGEGPRLAGVSAFGFGGSNAHAVLEEAPPETAESVRAAAEPRWHLLPLSARTDNALRDLARRYIELLEDKPPTWADICHTAAVRRTHHDCRLAVLANSAERAAQSLRAFLEGGRAAPAFAGRKPFGRRPKIAFLYEDCAEGWGSLPPDLQLVLPSSGVAVQDLDACLRHAGGPPLQDLLDGNSPVAGPASARLSALAWQLALTAWWHELGVAPDVVLGRGSGELASACVSGILAAEDAFRAIMSETAAFAPNPARLPFVSARDGRAHPGPDLDTSHWRACLAGAPDWGEAIIALQQREVDIWFTVGPGSPIEPKIQTAEGIAPPALRLSATGEAGSPDGRMLAVAGALYAAGCELSWERLAPSDGRAVRLPTYPWQRQRLWAAGNKWQSVEMVAAPGPQPEVVQPPGRNLPRPELTAPYVAPRSDLERALAEAWSGLLGIDAVGVHDNFFELGGHSLLATQAVSRIAREFHVEVPLREMFESPTIAQLATCIEADRLAGVTSSHTEIPRVSREGEMPLSLTQEALWFLDQLERGRPTYTVFPKLRIRGPLDITAVERALDEISRRHEALRTRFPEVDGRPIQRIEAPQARRIPVIDLAGLPNAERDAALERWMAEDTRRPIDLQNGPLIRVTILRLGPEEHVLVGAAHHIIYDGWSFAIMAREFSHLYRAFREGAPSPLPELTIQYADFAAWQRGHLQGAALEPLLAYWTTRLARVPPLDLPTDHPRPSIRSGAGDTLPCDLSPELSASVREFCRREGVTPFMVLLSAFQVLLAKYSGQEDFAVGSPVANRLRPETEPLIGYFINMVALRADLSGDPGFRALVHRVRADALGAFEHQEVTLDRVVDAVRPPRDASRHPLFQVMFVLQNNETPSLDDLGLQIESIGDWMGGHSSFFELTLAMGDTAREFQGSFNFSTDLFSRDTITRMARHYCTLLAGAIADPDRPVSSVPVMDDAEREMQLAWASGGGDPGDGGCVHEWIAARANETPDAVALVEGTNRVSYRQLDRCANRLANHLRSCGVVPDRVVAVRLPRSAEQVVAFLAVLKAGGAYLPLDPALPAERLRLTLEDSGADLIVTHLDLARDLPEGARRVVCVDGDREVIGAASQEPPPTSAKESDMAYVIYTSGSTGRPKGVMIEHRALAGYVRAAVATYGMTRSDRVLQFASASYDGHVEEIYPCLACGATLVLRDESMLDARKFLGRCEAWELTFLTLPTGFWHELTTAIESEGLSLPCSVRMVVIGGEQARAERVAAWFRQIGEKVRLVNTYGPTEATVVTTATELCPHDAREERVPIGRPLPNLSTHVLDGSLRTVPVGIRGELYIGGAGLARGYLNQPDLTAERFLPDPFDSRPGGRLYRTGDVARWLPDGRLEFCGRTDHQVKIRGYRIELGEVEQVLREHPLLLDAAVVARERSPGDSRLVAYVVGRDDDPPTRQELRRYLSAKLPDFMVPSVFVPMTALPGTASGKVDRTALPDPDWGRDETSEMFVPPSTEDEKQLATVWREVLSVDRVGAEDSFFDLGGNSLLALRLASRVRGTFGVDLPLTEIFIAPRLTDLAARIGDLRAGGSAPRALPIRPSPRGSQIPITYAQDNYRKTYLLFPDNPVGHMHVSVSMTGNLDEYALLRTIKELVQRHETLRTCFAVGEDDTPYQVIAPELPIELPVTDLSQMPDDTRATEVERLSQSQASGRFDLGRAPLWRMRLLRLGPNEHALLTTMHHIISDGWSVQVLLREVATLYTAFSAGRPSPLQELPIQYADYAFWQREYLRGDTLESLLGYWREKLAGARSPALPLDRPWEPTSKHSQAAHSFRIDESTRARLRRICHSHNVTMACLLLTAFKVLLQRIGGDSDITVATDFANRDRPETHGLIGAMLHALYLRTDLSGDPTFREAMARVRQTMFGAFQHQEIPHELLAQVLQPDHDPRRFPIVQVLFNYLQRVSSETFSESRDLELALWPIEVEMPVTRWALVLEFSDTDRALDGCLEYDSSLFDAATIEHLAGQYRALIQDIIADTDRPISLHSTSPAHAAGGGATIGEIKDVPLIREIAASLRPPAAVHGRSLVPLRAGGTGCPLYCIHGLGGHAAVFMPLANALAAGRPVYGFQGLGLDPGQQPHDRIEAMAEHYLNELRGVQARGPFLLAGWSLGGLVALELAGRLAAAGETISLVAMLDTYLSISDFGMLRLDDRSMIRWIAPQLNIPLAALKGLPIDQQWEKIAEEADLADGVGAPEIRRLAAVCRAHITAARRHRPRIYSGPAVLFLADEGSEGRPKKRWRSICPGLRVDRVRGGHYTILREPLVADLAARLDLHMETAIIAPHEKANS